MQLKFESRALRQLAEEVIDKITEGGDLFPSEREELVTSLVRQWTTYDGQAALFIGEQPYFFPLVHTPLGRPHTTPSQGPRDWLGIVATDWNIDPEELPDVASQLNRGQSAEVVNRDGVSIRVWTNPSEGRCAVEPLEPVQTPQTPGVDYLKLATRCIVDRFGNDICEEETDQLATSLMKQWKKFDGHAGLFQDETLAVYFTLHEHANGSNIAVTEQPAELNAFLDVMDALPDEAPALLARLNLGQTITFRNAQGVDLLMWHDPKQRRMICNQSRTSASNSSRRSLFASCQNCSALLAPQADGALPPTCPICGCATKTAP